MTPKGEVDRMAIVRSISRAIQEGKPIPLFRYDPVPPANAEERLQDAIIKKTLEAAGAGRTPPFSGISGR